MGGISGCAGRSSPGFDFSDAQPRFAEMWPRLDMYAARGGTTRYGRPSLLPRSGAGLSTALPAADPKMADQSWNMAAMSGDVREVHAPGRRGGGAWALSGSSVGSPAYFAVASHSTSESGGSKSRTSAESWGPGVGAFSFPTRERSRKFPQAAGRPGGAG